MLREQHGNALVVADPSSVAVAAIRQMRRKHDVQVVVGQHPLHGLKPDFLQYHVAVWVGQDFFVNAIASAVGCIGQFKRGDSGFDRMVFKSAVTLLFGEKIAAVGNNESHVASASLIDAGKVDFIEDAVAYCEPHFAVLVKSCTDATLGARRPSRRNAGPTRSITWSGISHTKPYPRFERCLRQN